MGKPDFRPAGKAGVFHHGDVHTPGSGPEELGRTGGVGGATALGQPARSEVSDNE